MISNLRIQKSSVPSWRRKSSRNNERKSVYITASKNEPSGNHHIEAAQCGLPILYINSGGIPEYSNGFGIVLRSKRFLEKGE